jgi:hypothetical protein
LNDLIEAGRKSGPSILFDSSGPCLLPIVHYQLFIEPVSSGGFAGIDVSFRAPIVKAPRFLMK